jgi:transposase
MSRLLVSDEPQTIIAPLLPPEPPKLKGGRPHLDNRKFLPGMIFFEERQWLGTLAQ